MNPLYSELAERISGEAPELERVVQRASRAWLQAQRTPEEFAYLDSVAWNLHSLLFGIGAPL